MSKFQAVLIIAKHWVCQVFFRVEFSSSSFAQVVNKFGNFSHFDEIFAPGNPPPPHPLLTHPQNPLNTLFLTTEPNRCSNDDHLPPHDIRELPNILLTFTKSSQKLLVCLLPAKA
jgi:hypothetical protein